MAKALVVMALAVGMPDGASALSPEPAPPGSGGDGGAVLPEPSAAALFGLGAALVAARSRKRR